MNMTQSFSKYMVDGEMILKALASAAFVATEASTVRPLPRESGLRGHSDVLAVSKFAIVLDTDTGGNRATGGVSEETYVFTIEVADDAAFTQNVTTIHNTTLLPADVGGYQVVAFDDDEIDKISAGAPEYIRVLATLGGTAPSIAYSAYIAPLAND